VYSMHHKKVFFSTFLCFLSCTVFCVFFLSSAFAKDETIQIPQKTSPSRKPIVVDADEVEYLDEQQKIVGRDNVRIVYDDVILKADLVTVDMKSKSAQASGNVTIDYEEIKMHGEILDYDFDTKMGTLTAEEADPTATVDIFYEDVAIHSVDVDFDLTRRVAYMENEVTIQEGGTEFKGNKLKYSFTNEQGSFYEVNALAAPWFGKAQKATKANDTRIDLDRAYLTTCDRAGKPHYRIQARRIAYYTDDKVVAKNALLFVGRIPVMYFPYWRQSLKDGRTNVSVSFGRKKEWGWFVLTSWRYMLNEEVKAVIHLDERELKGFASGIDVEYNTKKYGVGEFKTYFMNERDKFYSDETDRQNKDIQEKERYRAQVKHRWQVDKQTLLMAEYNELSDIDFTKDYLYREYEEDVQPVTEGSISNYQEGYATSLYARKRTNRFYSEVERLPQFSVNTTSKQIMESGIYFREDATIANLNKKTAGSDIDTDANRLDTYSEVKYPTHLPGEFDWINVAPYTATRQTFYSKDRNGTDEDLMRGIHYYGIDVNTKFYKVSDLKTKFFGIEVNKLRHIMTPSIKYAYIHSPTISKDRLGEFDDIDAIDKENVFTFGIENYLQTKWKTPGNEELENTDLVYFYPHVDYRQNSLPGVKHFSFITTEFNVRPYRWLHVDSDAVFNQYSRRFQTANVDLAANHGSKWRVQLGKRYERDTSEQFTSDLFYEINRLWQARVYTRYLSYTDTFQEQQYTIYRDLHCWLLEMTYDIKLDEDGTTSDRTFWFIFRLKAFPDEDPIRFNVGYESTERI